MQFPESQVQTYNSQFDQVVYNTPAQYTATSGQLAPLVGVFLNPTYICGQILAQYNLHAPSPDLVGQFVNYSAASSNADQAVPVAILIQQWVNTPGGDLGFWNLSFLTPPLILSGTQMAFANEAADITAFLTAIPCYQPVPASCLGFFYDGQPDQVYIIK